MKLTDARRRALHFRNQGLDQSVDDSLDVIGRLGAYSTSPTSHLGLIARVEGYATGDLDALIAERKVVIGSGVRGSGYLATPELVPMLVAVGTGRRQRLEREILSKGDNSKVFDRLARRVEKTLKGTELAGADIKKAVKPREDEEFVYSWTLRIMAERRQIGRAHV